MKKKTKTTQPSTKRKKPEKNCERLERIRHTKDQIIALGDTFKKWCREQADDPKSRYMVIERFWAERNIHPNTPLGWCKKYPAFKEDYELGKVLLGCKKLEGVYAKEYEPNKTTFMLHEMLPGWKRAEKYHADLKNIKDAVAQLLGVTFDVPDLEGKE